ncbi:hypothetical protein ElyMa_004990700 [Elysia marginata]|uniref:Reelin domain-containing protein n=1 Tax=Elysia marginata TaxID=1093978 RepID=A0AAV4J646_9GAST|nr:hypothetical protein ElyMa_004990700 [Elysia marginata]
MGVMVETTGYDAKGNAFSPGTFDTTVDMRVQDLREDKTCQNPIIAHRYLISKDGIKFLWTAPGTGAGCVHFK